MSKVLTLMCICDKLKLQQRAGFFKFFVAVCYSSHAFVLVSRSQTLVIDRAAR